MTFDEFNLELYVYFVNAIKRSIILIGDPDLTNDKMKIWTKYIWDLILIILIIRKKSKILLNI